MGLIKKGTLNRWRWGVVAALAMVVLSLIPQAHLWYARGGDWQGSYAYIYSDEPAYAAYTNALIDGRPRRNDPYTGRDDRPDAPQPESLFSIQFFPAYLLALPARALGVSASTAFLLLAPLIAFFASLAVFRLIYLLTGDERVAACGVPVVLCLGILISGQGFILRLVGAQTAYVALPFLRRYVPGVPFVFFFVFCCLVWRALTTSARRGRLLFALAAGCVFALLVYSYFFIWTAAAAWLACLAACWLIWRPGERRASLEVFAVIGVLAVCALIPYAVLLSHRAQTIDTVQALTYSRTPDVFRGVIFLDLLALAALVYGAFRGWIKWDSRAVLFTFSLTLMILVVFNQQVVTGRSLQPMHYEQYIGNYVVLLATVIAAALLWRGRGGAVGSRKALRRAWVVIAVAAFLWGAEEVVWTSRRFITGNILRDEWRAVALRLVEMEREAKHDPVEVHPVVFFETNFLIDNLPVTAPHAVLWSPHMFVFPGVTVGENKERFFQYLYYSGVKPEEFSANYRRKGFIHFAIFGWERANPRLTVNHKPITDEEILTEQNNYADYINSFTRDRAARPLLSYAATTDYEPTDFSNLDRWYERDAGERMGNFTLYRLKLRD